MNAHDYAFLSAFLQDKSGVVLGEDKEYLLEARLGPLARQSGLQDLAELIAGLRQDQSSISAMAVIDAMVTTETAFFRDQSLFEDLVNRLLPSLMAARAET